MDTPAIVARAAAYPGDQAYAYGAPHALKAANSAASASSDKVVSRRAQRDVAASAQHVMEEEVGFLHVAHHVCIPTLQQYHFKVLAPLRNPIMHASGCFLFLYRSTCMCKAMLVSPTPPMMNFRR